MKDDSNKPFLRLVTSETTATIVASEIKHDLRQMRECLLSLKAEATERELLLKGISYDLRQVIKMVGSVKEHLCGERFR